MRGRRTVLVMYSAVCITAVGAGVGRNRRSLMVYGGMEASPETEFHKLLVSRQGSIGEGVSEGKLSRKRTVQ